MLIDVHAHIGQVRPCPECILDADDLLRKMDAWQIDRSCILPLSEHPDPNYCNSDTEDILAACSRHPDRLTPFCLIDPRITSDNRERLLRERLTDYTDRGCRGLGELLPDIPFDDPRCIELYCLAGEYALPVLFDLHDVPGEYGLRDSAGLPAMERALRACPDTIFIGHGPTFWAELSADVTASQREGWPWPNGPVKPGGAVPRLMAAYDNLWADISAGSGFNALKRDPSFAVSFLTTFQDKILFGTDSCRRFDAEPLSPNREWMRRMRDERLLDEEVCSKIESGNARRLLHL